MVSYIVNNVVSFNEYPFKQKNKERNKYKKQIQKHEQKQKNKKTKKKKKPRIIKKEPSFQVHYIKVVYI